MPYSALQLNANALYQAVNQTGHGFEVGEIVRYADPNFVLADNTTSTNANLVGMVSSVTDADYFYVTQVGYVSGIAVLDIDNNPFVPNTRYYLADADGLLTPTRPTSTDVYRIPCYVAITATTGFFIGVPGEQIEPSDIFDTVVVDANTQMVVNTMYLINGAAELEMTLPVNATVGDNIWIATLGTNGVVIKQNAGQSINFVDEDTDVGVLGELELLTTNGVLQGSTHLICTVTDTNFKHLSGTGTWDIT